MTLLDPHLDIDQVSGAVDGERDPAVAAHLLACLACREQVDAWRRALAPLGVLPVAPVVPGGPDPVAEAMAAWTPPPAGLLTGPSPSRRAPLPGDRRGTTPWRLRLLRPPPAVAAVLILAVLVAGAVVALHGRNGTSVTTSAPASKSATVPFTPLGGAQARNAPTTPAAAGSGSVSQRRPGALAFNGNGPLAAELRRLTTTRPRPPGASTPCLAQARRLATADPAVEDRSPFWSQAVVLRGMDSRAFVFGGSHGHVAVVVRTGTCSLLATLLL